VAAVTLFLVRLTLSLDITNYRPRVAVRLEVPKAGSSTETIVITPSVISSHWTLNNHLVADELTVTMGWEESGCDPRLLKNSTVEFYMWDDERQEHFDVNDREKSKQFLRFAGICTKASRKLSDGVSEVTMTFNDYTTLFIHMKPFPTAGMPEYSDTLKQIWEKICDHTGAKDPNDEKKIISSVTALRDHLNVDRLPAEQQSYTLGKLVNERFHAIDKPSPHQGANAWEVWQWCVGSLGLVSYIQGTECVIMTTTEHYRVTEAPAMIYGENILEFEETSDTSISGKGIMLKSFDHLTGRTIEAVYPPPGDDRLKLKKSVAKRALKEGRDVSLNEVSADYQEFNYYTIQNQEALNIRAKEAYEEYSRQQMDGTLKTSEMCIEGFDGQPFDILSLQANDSIIIKIDPDIRNFESADEAYHYMVDVLGYNDGLAQIVAQNIEATELQSPIFHVTSMNVEYAEGKCDIEIKYHNLVTSRDDINAERDAAAIRGF